MVKMISRIGSGTGRYVVAAAMIGLLVGCGGGSSGDVVSMDEQDADNDGIPNGEDDDDDGDGVLDTFDSFVDRDNDGLDDTSFMTQAEIDGETPDPGTDPDPGSGFTEVSAASPCGSDTTGTDNSSINNSWNDNCEVKRSSVGGQFADSLYAAGIQRVLFCKGFATDADTDYTVFAEGEYGPASEAAMIRFQSTQTGLSADGIVGPMTWGRLQEQVELLSEGQPGVTPDVWGFTTGACANIPMFYQDVIVNSDGSNSFGGWDLAGNTPNTDQRVPFSYQHPFGELL